ncbi:transcriptional regulator [Pasteurellaceae bacterium 15-036681]|nr:transcriptional regulator [Pasteurellaceae bacterium 15-036681]
MTSLKDVAELAKVSMMTVSRALNSPEKLNSETYQRVKSAIEQLNYEPDPTTRSSRKTKEKTVAVLSLGTATTPLSVDILLAIEQTAYQHRWNTLVINVFEDNPRQFEQAVERVIQYRPTGIIIARNGLKNIKIPRKLRDFPIVLANCVTDDIQVASYIPDDYQGQRDIARLIVEKGYRKPLFLHIPINYIATQNRKQGFEDVWFSQESPLQPVHFFMQPDEENYLGGAKPLADLLENGEPFDFDVVVCGNDRIAFVAYQLLLRKGLKIPEDVAVTGYDNMVGVAHLFLPPLTTVQLPHYEMGEQAMLHFIQGRTEKETVALKCSLIARQSV